jgi:hypothetical protein
VEVYPGIRDLYLSAISKPMDISTMARKLKARKYSGGKAGVEAFRADVRLMVENCRSYNSSNPMFLDFSRRLLLVYKNLMKKHAVLSALGD